MKKKTATQNVSLTIHVETPLPEPCTRQERYELECRQRLQVVTDLLRAGGPLPRPVVTDFLHTTFGIGYSTARDFLQEALRNKWLCATIMLRNGHYVAHLSLPTHC